MLLNVDQIVPIPARAGKALRFNFIVVDPNRPKNFVAMLGFRLMSGCIFPPQAPRNGKWLAQIFLGEKVARALYDRLYEQLQEKGLSKEYPILSRNEAIEPLIDKAAIRRFFPTYIEEFCSDEETDGFDLDPTSQEYARKHGLQ